MNQKSTKRFRHRLHAYFLLALAIVLSLNASTTFAQSGNCACTNSNSNLSTTGSFEAGANNFNSITKSDLGLVLPRNGSYEVVSNAIYGSGGGYLNIAPHSGSKLMLIHTSANAGDRLWATTIAVVPGHTYQFCAWIANAKINPTEGFTITLNANKTVIATGTAVYGWSKLCGSYTVPAGTTSVEFSIKDPNPGFGPSHFLALDDICLTGDNRIGDFVWNDINANGSQDAGEGGIPNVTVSLYTCLNVLVGTTTTNAGGIYSFTNFNPGSYYVAFSLPSGYTFSPANQGGDITKDSDPNTVTGKSGCVTLTSGQANITVDAGLYRKASLGDLVWNDANANGKQDAGETGIANVTVTLFTCANLQVSATTTNSGGIYAFNNLTPGSYYVMFTLPSGYGYSPANQGADISKDSDPNPATGKSGCVSLSSGQANTTLDAGLFRTTSLGDLVWNDANANGIQDAGETGKANVTVTLYTCANVLAGTTITNSSGIYAFTNLPPGSFYVMFILPSGYSFSAVNQGGDITKDSDPNPASGKSGCITLIAGQANRNVDAGLYQKTSLGDFVWNDLNANGMQDAGEPGLANVIVTLYTCANVLVSSTATNTSGIYSFTNLTPGSYYVVFTQPSGYSFSAANGGGDITKDSDPNIITGKSGCVTLASAQNNTAIDAGLYQKANVGNTVWYDINKNGIKDAGEPGLSGVTINLYVDANNDNIADGAAVTTTKTDAGGNYGFEGLVPGNYIVGVVIPAGYAAITINGGDPDNDIDNDNNGQNIVGAEIRSNALTLNNGAEPSIDGDGANGNLTVDVALTSTGSIGDFVWHDLDANGRQDETEPGRKGIIVTLTYPNSTTVSTVTGVDGKYLFSNLEPGNYVVSFSTPDHFFLTLPNVGSDDAMDSDPVNGNVEVTLGAGENNNTIDAGVYCDFLSVGNYVWYDQNNDGIQDASETGIGGATVKLYRDVNADNLPDGTAVATTTTNPGGLYSFASIKPGKYIIGVSIPAGYSAGVTTATSATPDNDDNTDNNGVTIVDGELRSNYITLITTFEPTNDGDPFNGNTTLDFGFIGSGSIGDFVFHDLDANGIQDIIDPGRKGVIVTLTYPNGATVSAITPVDGKYLFSNLAPGNYMVAFLAPDHFFLTFPNVGSDDTKDSDPVNGNVEVTLGAGENNKTIDAGMYCDFLSVGNYVWYDQNNDGIQDASETGIGGATVRLYRDVNADNVPDGTAVATTTTSPNGLYSFPSIMPGKYIVGVTIPAGYSAGVTTATSATPDNDDNTDNNGVTIVDGELRSNYITLITTFEPTNDGDPFNGNTTLDFGFNGSGSIGDFVFHDLDANGIQDIIDPGKKGVIVTLTYPNGATVSALTLVDGKYLFNNLAPGNYMVTFLAPDHFFLTLPNVGLNDAKDSDPVNGTVEVTLGAGENNKTIDAGTYCDFLSVGNFVWNDENNNGIQDPAESGIGGATVNLYLDANADNVPDGTAVVTTVTKANGLYSFPSIFPGKFIVGVTVPAGYSAGATTATSANPDNDDNTDNNGVSTVGGELRSNFITLITTFEPITDGDNFNGNTTLDFGLYSTAINAARGTNNTINGGQAIKNVYKGFQILGVYPNPFADKIIIGYTSEKAQKVTIRILDNAGKMVYSTRSMVQAGKNNIQLSSLSRYSAGGYMVELRTNNEVYINQIMK